MREAGPEGVKLSGRGPKRGRTSGAQDRSKAGPGRQDKWEAVQVGGTTRGEAGPVGGTIRGRRQDRWEAGTEGGRTSGRQNQG